MASVEQILLLFLYFIQTVQSAQNEDLIASLPGIQFKPNFKQYSGYLDVSATKHLHYWLTLSQTNSATDPVILWLNGGPGCSSLEGILSENGPFTIDGDGSRLHYNPYSWNKQANMLYLESPAEVGFSYDDTNKYVTGDRKVAIDNLNALLQFFEKFPEFSNNPLFISGESYGGIYLPTLAQKIIHNSKLKKHFKGMAIGNGLYNYASNSNSLMFYSYYHGLLGEEEWKQLVSACCNGAGTQESCDFSSLKLKCTAQVTEAYKSIQAKGVNQYALYSKCENSKSKMFAFRNGLLKLPMQIRDGLKTTPGCINDTAITSYLRRDDVRSALHISNKALKWKLCSDRIFSSYFRYYDDMKPFFADVFVNSTSSVLLYSGDTDLVVNFLGTQWFIQTMNRKVVSDRKPWYVEGQVAGFVDLYDKLSFYTIKGAGHMVPEWAPKFAYNMFTKFIEANK